jgi:hypothetical protein
MDRLDEWQQGQTPDEERGAEAAVEYDVCLSAVLVKDIPESSYVHIKDLNGIYYIFRVAQKAGNFIFVECVSGPKAAENKRGIMRNKVLMLKDEVSLGLEEVFEGNTCMVSSKIAALQELIVSREATPFLPDRPLIYNSPVQSFNASSLPEGIVIEIDTESRKKYTLKVLKLDESGDIYVSVEGEGKLNGTIGRLRSTVIGENYKISIKDIQTHRDVSSSKVTEMIFRAPLDATIEQIILLQHQVGKRGPFDQ